MYEDDKDLYSIGDTRDTDNEQSFSPYYGEDNDEEPTTVDGLVDYCERHGLMPEANGFFIGTKFVGKNVTGLYRNSDGTTCLYQTDRRGNIIHSDRYTEAYGVQVMLKMIKRAHNEKFNTESEGDGFWKRDRNAKYPNTDHKKGWMIFGGIIVVVIVWTIVLVPLLKSFLNMGGTNSGQDSQYTEGDSSIKQGSQTPNLNTGGRMQQQDPSTGKSNPNSNDDSLNPPSSSNNTGSDIWDLFGELSGELGSGDSEGGPGVGDIIGGLIGGNLGDLSKMDDFEDGYYKINEKVYYVDNTNEEAYLWSNGAWKEDVDDFIIDMLTGIKNMEYSVNPPKGVKKFKKPENNNK